MEQPEEIQTSGKRSKYTCLPCGFYSNHRHHFIAHQATMKHYLKVQRAESITGEQLACTTCQRIYRTNSGLWKHQKKCGMQVAAEAVEVQPEQENVEPASAEMVAFQPNAQFDVVRHMVSENEGLKAIIHSLIGTQQTAMQITQNSMQSTINQLIEVAKINTCNAVANHTAVPAGNTNTNTNTNTFNHGSSSANHSVNCNNNNNNNHFNLQFFLNETCKHAMNIDDFVDSIQVELSDLENIGKVGYVQGISDVIISNLNKLDITERPIHCTDKKREVIYVKKPELWEKDDERKSCVRNVIRKVLTKNRNMLPVYKQQHPDCFRSSSRFADQYNQMIVETMVTETEAQDAKIIRNMCKNTGIDRESLLSTTR